jgi:Bacterial capsule synthesis protein PGA_cap
VIAAALLLAFACDTVRVCAGGDITLGTNLDTAWKRKAKPLLSPDSLVTPLVPFFAGADIILINAEGAFGDDPPTDTKCHKKKSHCFVLRQPARAAIALRKLGDSATVVANVANNHAHDAGDDGFVHSVHLLRQAGLLVTGADTLPTLAVTKRGDTIAVFGFSAWSSPGVNDLTAVTRLVTAAHARYGRVIVTAHMGAEGADAQRTGDSTEHYVGEDRGNVVAFAHAVMDAGAWLVIGHGPHVLRAAEWRDSALVLYSLGNFLNYGPFNMDAPRNSGAVVCATLDSLGAPNNVLVEPTHQISEGIVRADSSGRARVLLDSLSGLDFPSTGVTIDSTGAVRRRPPPTNPSPPADSVPPRADSIPSNPDPHPSALDAHPSMASPGGR